MIELPNNKISRNLPEQVGFNSAKIAEIIKWINDSDFLDKVIDLSDPSGTLTAAQYDIADLSPSYIVYGGKVFVKSLEDSSNIDFFKVGTDMSGSGSIVASVERVRVVKATKAYQYETVQLFESYNKSQLDTLLGAKADLSGATFTGAVVAPTLEQEENNWEEENFLNELVGLPTGLSYEKIYAKACIINKMFYMVALFKLTNTTESSIASFNSSSNYIRDIPSSVGSKIYDASGKNLVETLGGAAIQGCDFHYSYSNSNLHVLMNRGVFCTQSILNGMQLEFFNFPSIPAGESRICELRFFLVL